MTEEKDMSCARHPLNTVVPQCTHHLASFNRYNYYNATLTEGQVLKTDYILYSAFPTQLVNSAVLMTQIPISTVTDTQ